MSSLPTNAETATDEALWRRVEMLLDEVESHVAKASGTAEFHSWLIERTRDALAARGGAVWSRVNGQDLRPTATAGPLELAEALADARCRELVTRAAQGPSHAACLSAGEAWGSDLPGHADATLVVAAISVDDRAAAVMVVVWDEPAPRVVRQHGAALLSSIARAAAEFHRRHEVQTLRRRLEESRVMLEMLRTVHRSRDPREVAGAIANEGRRLTGCDRLSVVVKRGSRPRVLAVSGVDEIDRRSEDVCAIESLTAAVARTGEDFWSDEVTEAAPEITQPLDAYFDVAGSRSVAILPLRADSTEAPAGWLFGEQFSSDRFESEMGQGLGSVAFHTGPPLAGSLELESLPLLSLSRGLRRMGRALSPPLASRTLVILAAVTVAVASLCLIPIDFTIPARGELQPAVRRDVFATADGQITATHVAHGERVQAGAVLVELRNAELDYEAARLRGEIDTTRARLRALEPRLNLRPATTDEAARLDSDAAEVERLKTLLAGLLAQEAILNERLEELHIRAPIDGDVLSWNVAEMLASRPVRRGQKLLTLGDAAGPWKLEVHVADADVGHVLAAREAQRDAQHASLPIDFLLVTDPATVYHGRLDRIALATDATLDDGPAVLVTALAEPQQLAEPRPGAGVVARIHCGRRPIGYVWLRRLIEAARKQLFF